MWIYASWKVDVTLTQADRPLTNHRTIDEAELGAAAVLVRYGGRTLGTYGQDLRSFFDSAVSVELEVVTVIRPHTERFRGPVDLARQTVQKLAYHLDVA